MEYLRPIEIKNNIETEIVSAAYAVHKELGPGLLEKVYEVCLAYELGKRGLNVERQLSIPIEYDNIVFNEVLRLDVLVNKKGIIELKSA